MLITTSIDTSGALDLCDTLLKKVPYATNNALTRVAKELVTAERDQLKSEFQVRKQFVLNLVRITKYATVTSLWTRVAIDRTKVQGGAVLLTMFEEGGEKTPELGSEIAIPLTGGAARPSFGQSVTPSLMYKALNMKRTAAGQFKGGNRTFIIPGIGVFQRTTSRQRVTRGKALGGTKITAKGEDPDLVLLYAFKPGAPLRARMQFVSAAGQLVRSRFPAVWREEFVRELGGRARA